MITTKKEALKTINSRKMREIYKEQIAQTSKSIAYYKSSRCTWTDKKRIAATIVSLEKEINSTLDNLNSPKADLTFGEMQELVFG